MVLVGILTLYALLKWINIRIDYLLSYNDHLAGKNIFYSFRSEASKWNYQKLNEKVMLNLNLFILVDYNHKKNYEKKWNKL